MKKIILLLLALLMVFSVTSCFPDEYEGIDDTPDKNLPAPETVDELYSVYNQINYDMSKKNVEELFGKGELSSDKASMTYYNETKSAGVTILYSSNDQIQAKTLFFNTKKNLVPFSKGFDDDKVAKIERDSSIASAVEIIGSSPLEISCTYGKNGPDDLKLLYAWFNEDGSSLILEVSAGKIENIMVHR